jgi:hypothetical protein
MPPFRPGRRARAALALPAIALSGLALAGAASAAGAPEAHHARSVEPLVVRGTDTVKDSPCPAGICIELTEGAFHGTPVGSGAYDGSVELRLAEAFPNGEGGVCAPLAGRITLGAGTADRLVLAVAGDSCQDGAGNPATSSFTGLARFRVVYGTGAWAGASGHGNASFVEDAADHEQMTLIGRIRR